MKLENSEWRFESPGGLPGEVVGAFDELVGKIVGQRQTQSMLEHFKKAFYGGLWGRIKLEFKRELGRVRPEQRHDTSISQRAPFH